jgi:hypothetical protein
MRLPDVRTFLKPAWRPRGLRRKREIARLNRELALAKALLAVDGRGEVGGSLKPESSKAHAPAVEQPLQKTGDFGSWSPGQIERPPPTEAELAAADQARRAEEMKRFRRSMLVANVQAAAMRNRSGPWTSMYWRGGGGWSSYYWK